MRLLEVLPYLQNTFWLSLPILVFNIVFVRRLPRPYQMDIFWKNIPSWIGVPENLCRVPVFLLPLVMRFGEASPNQKLGVGLYTVGVLLYFAAWGAQISMPRSAWSVSAAGFMGPSYTRLIWLAGIALIGKSLTIPKSRMN